MTRSALDDRVLLNYLRSYVKEHGYPPSTREMASALGVPSTRTVHECLVRLRDAGTVSWEQGRARTLRIVDADRELG